MNVQQFQTVADQQQAQLAEHRSHLVSAINMFHASCENAAFEQISDRSHMNLNTPDVNPQHALLPSDVFKALSPQFPDVAADDEFAPPFPPNYASALASEAIKASSLPGTTVNGFLDFLAQFSARQITAVHSQQEQLLRRAKADLEYKGVEQTYRELERKRIWYADFGSRVLAICQHALISLSEPTLRQFYNATASFSFKRRESREMNALNEHQKITVQDFFEENWWAQRALTATDAYLTVEDMQRIIRDQDLQISLGRAIQIGMSHLNYVCREQIVDETINICTSRRTCGFSYFSNMQDMVEFILSHSDIDAKMQLHKETENTAFLKQHLNSENEEEKLLLQMLENGKYQNNQQVEFEQFCSQILQQAIVRHQSFAEKLPSFIAMGYKINQNSVSTNVEVVSLPAVHPIYLSHTRTSEFIQRVDCISNKSQQLDDFTESAFVRNISESGGDTKPDKSVIDCLALPSTFQWKMAVKECDYSLNFIFGLLAASNPQNRQYAAESFLQAEIQKNLALMERLNCQVSGRSQIVEALHLTRFDEISQIYGDLVMYHSQLLVILHKMTNQEVVCPSEWDAARYAKGGDKQTAGQFDFRRILQNEDAFNEFLQFEEAMQEINRQGDCSTYEFDGPWCRDQKGKKVVFQQAIDDVTVLLLQDQNAIQSYLDRIREVGKRKYLECLVFGEDYVQIKYEPLTERQNYVTSLSDQELYEMLQEDNKQKFADFQVDSYIDDFQIVFEMIQAERELERYKLAMIKVLFEVSLFSGKEQAEMVYNLIIQIVLARPHQFEHFSDLKSIEEEQGKCFQDFATMHNVDAFVISNMQAVHSPVTQLEMLAETYEMFYNLTDAIVQLQFEDQQSQAKNGPTLTLNGRAHALCSTDECYFAVVDTIFTLFATCSEIQSIFTSEANPKINQGLRESKDGHQHWYSYPVFVAKLCQAIQHAVLQSALQFFSVQVEEYRTNGRRCFALPSNLVHLAEPGLLNHPDILFKLLDDAVGQLKQNEQSSPEKVFCAIAGLLAPQGGSCQNCKPSDQTDVFSVALSLRDLYLQADKSSQTQLQQLLRMCNFTVFCGVPAVLPLPFQLYVTLLNTRHAFYGIQSALLEAHYLRKSECACMRATTECTIDEATILLYPRCLLDGERCCYREYYGPQCLTNNLPFAATIDRVAHSILMEKVRFESPEFITQILKSTDFALEKAGERDTSNQQNSIYDVLVSANLETAAKFPLFQVYASGLAGVFARASYAEICSNLLRRASLRANQAGVDFCITNERIGAGSLRIEAQRPLQYTFKNCDVGLICQSAAGPEKGSSHVPQFPQQLSSLYFQTVEDVFATLTAQAQTEYQFRMKTYHPEEINAAITFTHQQQAIFTVGRGALQEIRRLASIAQLRGLLSLIRTQLTEVSKDETTLLAGPMPIYRGKKRPRSLVQEPFLLTEDGFLTRPLLLSHPTDPSLFYYPSVVLDAQVIILTAYESVVRHSITKAVVSGQSVSSAGKLLADQLSFIEEIADIELCEDEDGDIDPELMSEFLQGREAPTLPRYGVRFQLSANISESEAKQIMLNVQKVQQTQEMRRIPIVTEIQDSRQGQDNIQPPELQHTQQTQPEKRQEVFQVLELSKTKLLLQKCIELRDKNELLNISSLTQALNTCTRKGLFDHARYLYVVLQKLNTRCSIPCLLFDSDVSFNGSRIYAQASLEAFCRIFRAQAQQNPQQPIQQFSFNAQTQKRQYAFESERGSHWNPSVFAQFLLQDDEAAPQQKEEKVGLVSTQEELFMAPAGYSSYEQADFLCGQYVSVEARASRNQSQKSAKAAQGAVVSLQDIENLIVLLQIGANQRGTSQRCRSTDFTLCVESEKQHCYRRQPYMLGCSGALQSMSFGIVFPCQFPGDATQDVLLGFGVDGTYSLFSPFGLTPGYFALQDEPTLEPFFYCYTKSLEAAMCAALTQTELQAIQCAHGRGAWEIVKEGIVLANARILQDRFERIVLSLHGFDQSNKDAVIISQTAILGQSAQLLFQPAFKAKLDALRDEELVHNSSYGQSKVPAARASKQKEQAQFLCTPLLLYVEEKALENVVDDACSLAIKQNIDKIMLQVLRCLLFQIQASQLLNISAHLQRRADFINQSLLFSEEVAESCASSDVEASFIKFFQRYSQQLSDLLILACREHNVQIGVNDFLQAALSMLGLAQEPTETILQILQQKSEGTDPKSSPKTQVGRTQAANAVFKQILYQHEFTPQTVVIQTLAFLHAGLPMYATHLATSRLLRELWVLVEAPERRVRCSTCEALVDSSAQLKGGVHGDFFKFRVLQVPWEEIMRSLAESSVSYIARQLENYYQFQYLRIAQSTTVNRQLTQKSKVWAESELRLLDQELKMRSIALLDPLALPQMRIVQALERQLYEAFEVFLDNERKLREQMHEQSIEQILGLSRELIGVEYQIRKVRYLQSHIEEQALQERNQASRQVAAHLYQLSGINVENEPQTLKLCEFAQNDARQSVVENYQRSIAEGSVQLQNIQIQILLFQSLANYRQQIIEKRRVLQKQATQAGIVAAFRALYELIIKTAQLDQELLQQLTRVTALISVKQSEAERGQKSTQRVQAGKPGSAQGKRPKTADPAAKGQQLQGAAQQTLQQQMAAKMLPQLQNSAVQKSVRICSEGEALLVQYKHETEENKALQQQLEQVTDALRIMREKHAVDRQIYSQSIKRESSIIQQQEQQAEALEKDINQLQVLTNGVLQQEQQNARISGDAMAVKLKAEIAAVQKLRQTWKQKNDELRAEYDELFRLIR